MRRWASIALLVVAGAGRADSQRPHAAMLNDAFRTRVEAVCKNALAEKRAQGPFPYPKFNPTRPDRSELPGVARYEMKGVVIYRRWLREMQALGRPASGNAAWIDLLKALRGHLHVIAEQATAAQLGHDTTFTKDYYEGNEIQAAMQKAADAAGVRVCSDAAAA